MEKLRRKPFKSAVQLATAGLNLAPPNGDASVPVIVGLLALRAEASIRYGENKSALTDLL